MNVLLSILAIGAPLTVGAFLSYGMGYKFTRKCLEEALNEAEAGRYEAARAGILNAVRLMPEYKKHADLVAFYDAVIEKRAAPEVPRMREAMANWQPSKLEKLYPSDGITVAFAVLSVLVRLANLP